MPTKGKGRQPDIFKNVLQPLSRTREQAAWQLLGAINELFPSKINELRALGERLRAEGCDDPEVDGQAVNLAASDRFRRGVQHWTVSHRIASPAVDEAAEQWAAGNAPEGGLYLVDEYDENLNLVKKAPRLYAYPFNETREEFLEKAGKYYDQLVQLCAQRGSTLGPVKRDVEHFRYLAAHLVGGYTWAEIANGNTSLSLSRASQRAIAEGAREVAMLLGITMTTKRGARKGAPRHRRPLRR